MKSQKILVAIGPPQGGKSTFCDHVAGFGRVSFATPLYEMLSCVLGRAEVARMRADNTKGGPLPRLGGKSLREALQTLGTEWGRQMMHEDIWVDVLLGEWAAFPHACLAIDDLRFPNEYDKCKEMGAVFVRMMPHEELRKNGWDGHESESYWRTFKCHAECRWDTREEIVEFAKGFDFESFRGLEPEM